MADKIENLMLEHLKRFQPTLDRVENKLTEMTGRVANLEGGQASIILHLGHLATADAAQQLSTDHVNERLECIARRLELIN